MLDEQDLIFVIDGAEYPAPSTDTFNMAERRLLFELSGITQEDLVREEDESKEDHEKRVRKTLRHPGFMETLMHVAYARGNPTLKPAKVAAVIASTNYLDAIEKWGEEDEASPPAISQSEPSKLSEPANGSSKDSSGGSLSSISGRPDRSPESTGTSESVTSSRAWSPVG